MTGKYLYLYYI